MKNDLNPLEYLHNIDKNTFDSQLLKVIRIKLNFSQEGFARAIDVSFGTYSGWERGKQVPSYQGLKKLRNFAEGQLEQQAV